MDGQGVLVDGQEVLVEYGQGCCKSGKKFCASLLTNQPKIHVLLFLSPYSLKVLLLDYAISL